MTLTEMKVEVEPYEDASGSRFQIILNTRGEIELHQNGDWIYMTRDQCRKVMDAIDALWATSDQISRADR